MGVMLANGLHCAYMQVYNEYIGVCIIHNNVGVVSQAMQIFQHKKITYS